MKDGSLVMKCLSGLSHSLFASAVKGKRRQRNQWEQLPIMTVYLPIYISLCIPSTYQRARKFSTVLGTAFPNNPRVILPPSSLPSISTSKKTLWVIVSNSSLLAAVKESMPRKATRSNEIMLRGVEIFIMMMMMMMVLIRNYTRDMIRQQGTMTLCCCVCVCVKWIQDRRSVVGNLSFSTLGTEMSVLRANLRANQQDRWPITLPYSFSHHRFQLPKFKAEVSDTPRYKFHNTCDNKII